MRGFNKVILMGNLARDPDIRETRAGRKMAGFTVACGREWFDKDSRERKSAVDFIRCVAWGNLADIVGKYLSKGKPAHVEGHLSVSSYEKNGQKIWKTDVLAESVILLSGSRQENGGYGERSDYSSPARHQRRSDADEDFYGDPDFPFDEDFGGDEPPEADVPF